MQSEGGRLSHSCVDIVTGFLKLFVRCTTFQIIDFYSRGYERTEKDQGECTHQSQVRALTGRISSGQVRPKGAIRNT